MDTVCTMAGAKYLELGLELGLLKEQIDVVEKDHRYCQKITREVIKAWDRKERNLATWEVLGDALFEIRAKAEFIKDICNTSRGPSKMCLLS